MRPKIAGTALASVGAIVAAVAMCNRSLVPDAAPREDSHDVAARRNIAGEDRALAARFEAELAGLRASQRETSGLVRAMQASARERASEPARHEPDLDDTHAQAEARMLAEADLLRDSFAQEAADSRWAPNAVELIRERYSSPEFAGVKVDANCKATLCRIEFEFPPGAQLRNGASLIAVKAPWTSQGFLRLDVERSRATFYVARVDHALPRIPEYADAVSRGRAP